MVKKSNKTEQVLKLITKDQEMLEGDDEEDLSQNKVHSDEENELYPIGEQKIDIEPSNEVQDKSTFQQSYGSQARCTLINIIERLTFEYVGEVMKRLNVCTCPVCTNDVIALTLNSLPPKYVTTDAGKQYLLLDTYKKQYETDIISALTKACVRVKVSPRH